jgi:hypothetical protein
MPRIEVVPWNWDNSAEARNGDGTPTIDVCKGCAGDFEEGEQLDLGEWRGATTGSTEVEHPPYSDGDYECGSCGKSLTNRDN